MHLLLEYFPPGKLLHVKQIDTFFRIYVKKKQYKPNKGRFSKVLQIYSTTTCKNIAVYILVNTSGTGVSCLGFVRVKDLPKI